MENIPEVVLRCLQARPMAQTRLVCVPHAGAGASIYRKWPSYLPETVEVLALQLPGREDRLDEQPFTRWQPMMEGVCQALDQLPPTPVALFGHSLGALIALAAARHLATSKKRLAHLFVSGRHWPGDVAEPVADIDTLSDEELLSLFTARYGTQGPAMDNPEIREMIMPVLRADFALLTSCRWQAATPLPCPVSVFTGNDDPGTADRDASKWQAETSSDFAHHTIEGGHLFHMDSTEKVLAYIRQDIAAG